MNHTCSSNRLNEVSFKRKETKGTTYLSIISETCLVKENIKKQRSCPKKMVQCTLLMMDQSTWWSRIDLHRVHCVKIGDN